MFIHQGSIIVDYKYTQGITQMVECSTGLDFEFLCCLRTPDPSKDIWCHTHLHSQQETAIAIIMTTIISQIREFL